MTQTDTESIRWDLSDLFSSETDPQINQILETTINKATNFNTTYKSTLHTLSSEKLNKAYQTLEALLTPLYKVSQYIALRLSTDTSNDALKALESNIDHIESEISNLILFFGLEISKLDANIIHQHLQNKAVKNYHYNIEHSFKTAQYNLSEKEEKIINLKDLTGADAFQKLYDEYTASFEFKFTLDGQEKTMTGSELRALRQHKNPNVRRRAMKTFYKKYEENQLIITHAFTNIVKDYNIEKKLRGYKSAISIRNSGNDLPDESVKALHDITTKSYPLVQRYYELKKKILNLPDLTLADIYAPMPKADKKFSYNEAKEIVLKGFKQFDSHFYNYAKMMFDENRIDVPVKKGKRGGAFCSGSTPDIKPYVLLNFLGEPRDVSTMAHELGHAIHDLLANKQTLFNYHPILPLAETASVFSEMLITDLLLKNETDKMTKQVLLTEKLEDIFATSHRQNMFSRFEIATHHTLSDSLMSSSDLCSLYQKELKKMFGNAVIQPEEYKWEWSTIPHIFDYPFYVYAYNFGNLLVMALYQQYLEEGKTFIPKFKAFLSAGSAKSPKDICESIHTDINDPNFWKKSIVYIESLINELESII